MVSMKDIATKCGVSVATVSKALSGQPDIGEEKRGEIKATAKEMGYLANSAARALRTHRTYNIGVLFVDGENSGLTHEFFNEVLDSFKVEAESMGYDLTFINRNISGKQMSYLQHCRYRGVDGVVIACVSFDDEQVLELVDSGIPIVTIDHVFDNKPAVVSDNTKGMSELVKYAYSKGHRKIAYIYGNPSAVTTNRKEGFISQCRELGLDVPPEYIRESIYRHPKESVTIARELLKSGNPPTCLMFSEDYTASFVANMLKEDGYSIPEDVSVIGYDDSFMARLSTPRLTTFHQDTDGMGRIAAKKLVEQIEHPKTANTEEVTVPGYLVEGKSVAEISKN